MTDRITAESFPPGHFLKRALALKGWSQNDLAAITGKPAAAISEIINGNRAITPDMAVILAEAFGTSAEVWMNLESQYQLSKVPQREASPIRVRAQLYSNVPVLKDMVNRNWIEPSKDADVLTRRAMRFFECDSLSEQPKFNCAARKSGSYAEERPELVAWLFRARQLARMVSVLKAWRSVNLRSLLTELRALMLRPEDTHRVPRVLAEFGIRFVVVEPISRSKVDGACFWIEDEPVIAMSLRFDRIDNFWFTLLHECAHVSQGDGSVDVDVQAAGDDRPAEKYANDFAAETLIPKSEFIGFRQRVGALYTRMLVRGFAARLGIHPGIVVGQIHHMEHDHRYFREMLVGIREYVVPSALTDGYGSTAPAVG